MARTAQSLRQLAHHLYAHESLVQERSTRSRVRGIATCSNRAHQDRGGRPGQHYRQSASGRHGGVTKRLVSGIYGSLPTLTRSLTIRSQKLIELATGRVERILLLFGDPWPNER